MDFETTGLELAKVTEQLKKTEKEKKDFWVEAQCSMMVQMTEISTLKADLKKITDLLGIANKDDLLGIANKEYAKHLDKLTKQLGIAREAINDALSFIGTQDITPEFIEEVLTVEMLENAQYRLRRAIKRIEETEK